MPFLQSVKSYNPLVPIFVAAVVGVLADFYLEPPVPCWLILFSFLFVLWIVLTSCRLLSEYPQIILVLIMTAFFFAFRQGMYYRVYPSNDIGLIPIEESTPLSLEGWVIQTPILHRVKTTRLMKGIESSDITDLILAVKQVKNGTDWQEYTGRISVRIAGDAMDLRLGDLIRVQGKYSKPLPPSNCYQWDQAFSFRSRRILCDLTVASFTHISVLNRKDRYPVAQYISQIRRQNATLIDRYMSFPASGYAKAMVLGIRDDLEENAILHFKQTGTIHLLVISGMHLGIVAFFLMLVCRIFLLSPHTSSLLVLAAIYFYLLMTDMGAPVLRATVLVSVFCLGGIVYRSTSSINTLALAGIVLLLLNPCELFRFGTHLSFLATGVILWGLDSRKRLNSFSWELYRVGIVIWETCTINILLWWAIFPLILYQTNLFTPIAMILNPLLWIPFAFSLFLTYLLILTGWFLPSVASFIGGWADASYHFLIDTLLNNFHSFPGGSYVLPSPPFWWVLVFYVVLSFWIFFPDYRPKRSLLIVCFLSWFGIGFFVRFSEQVFSILQDKVEITSFSVGHGGATLLTFPDGRNLLYDCGSFSSPSRAGELTARNIINKGRSSLDVLVLSHPDSDHYNGIETLGQMIDIRAVVVPPEMFAKKEANVEILQTILSERKIPLYYLASGDSLAKVGFPELSVLHPLRKEKMSEVTVLPLDSFGHSQQQSEPSSGLPAKIDSSNAMSLVLLLEHRFRRVLLTGDLDSNDVPFLHSIPPAIDVLFAPHHGGVSQISESLYQWGKPTIILVSDGHFHRVAERYQRLRQQGFEIRSTFEEGTLFVTIEKGKFTTHADHLGKLSLRTYRTGNIVVLPHSPSTRLR